jgi:ankyrin repeat protein
MEGNKDVVILLLSQGADATSQLTGTSPISSALKSRSKKCEEILRLLVSYGASVNDRGNLAASAMPPLLVSVALFKISCVKELLLLGCDVNTRDSNENSALHIVAASNLSSAYNEHEFSQYKKDILTNKANVNETNPSSSFSMEEMTSELIALLKQHGADCSLINRSGDTAMQVALKSGNVSASNALL